MRLLIGQNDVQGRTAEVVNCFSGHFHSAFTFPAIDFAIHY